MKRTLSLAVGLVMLLVTLVASAAPPKVLMNTLTTNTVANPPDDTYILGVVGGKPAFILAGTNTTVIMTIITNTQFLTFITTNLFSSLYVTNLYATNITVTTLNATNVNFYSNITYLSTSTSVFNGKTYLSLNLATNIVGTGFKHVTRLTPDSQGTNWIFDASTAVVIYVPMTNAMYIQYITNSLGLSSSGILFSLKLAAFNADQLLSVNSNYTILDTNGWTLSTALNPGVWQRYVTNTATMTTAGPRKMWISFDCNDDTYNPTNVTVITKLSP